MRRTLALAGLAAVLVGCGSSAGPNTPVAFGVSGGNIVPYTVTIRPGGSVQVSGSKTVAHGDVPVATVRRLQRDVQGADLTSRQCPGTLPDVASRFVRAGDRSVTVHGSCEPRFERLWNELARAVGLRLG